MLKGYAVAKYNGNYISNEAKNREIFSDDEFAALESNIALLAQHLADVTAGDNPSSPNNDAGSEALNGFCWAFSNLSYQVSRALFTSVEPMESQTRAIIRRCSKDEPIDCDILPI